MEQDLETKETKFTKLIENNQGIVHKICRIYTDSPEAHEDLFQEIVLQLWKSFDSFQGDSKFSTWMYRVGLNTAITLIRKKNRTIKTSSIDSQAYFDVASKETDELQQERLNLLYGSIKKLNDVERALVLLYLEDLPYREISATLGITEVNARVKMNRVKEKLRVLMNRNS
ncbi:MAG: sigma-70 family RNA polymerase sigma factor [Weeksellaceae bacterium]|nr:sigma-70 family RNA polymerase sigma factor [Weeksellaceae bacterium]